ncbi:hypothetical protein [Herbaspirillum sp. YR522]|uniref:hypothetical protein n=1 Tax=Herbaspirillum sp. YR522 TaxID=1144342 RepID=UPI00026F90F5|nr:hypothetical protein [Herbaspirillum sp. YR522]EJN07929.1 hypothetical protein PMI40_01556 [Herbaspirillum sp. YR522]
MIKTLAACAAVIALAGCVAPVTRTASGEIPASRVYIKSMTQQETGLSAIEFTRDTGLLNSQMMELAINDVVLAQITGGEHLTIWLKPGSYTFSIKPAQGLATATDSERGKVVVQVGNGGPYRVRIASDARGLKMLLAQ